MIISIPCIEGLQSQPLRIAKVDGDLDLVVLEGEPPASYLTIVLSHKDLAGMLARLDDAAFRAAKVKADGRWATSLAGYKPPSRTDELVARGLEMGRVMEECQRPPAPAGDSLVKQLASGWDAEGVDAIHQPTPTPTPAWLYPNVPRAVDLAEGMDAERNEAGL